MVVADRRRLRQVLLNVIGNAIKYNRQDGLVVTDSRREGAVVVLEITDEGPGLPDHAMDRVFQPFDRLGAERTQVQGAGLGLPLSKSLIEAMNGDLLLSRAPASGAVVQIRLPAA
jgi:signal transduction histidine kinase